MSKLIYAASLDAFKTAFPNYATPTDPTYRSVAYTGDGYIVTHGKTMKANVTGDTTNPYGLDYKLNGQTATVTVSGVSKSITLPVVGLSNGSADALTLSSSAGVFTIGHALGNSGWTGNQLVGPTADGSATIVVPQITFDKYGHYKSVTSRTARLDYVLQSPNADANEKYLLFGTASTEGRRSTQLNTAFKVVASTGTLYATVFNQNGKTLDATYAPIAHASTATTYGIGTSGNYGHVKLSDATNSTSAAASGVAATPKAVKDALDASKLYSESLFASNDAMVFVGTINASTGVIVTVNATFATKYSITAGTTKISDLKDYSAGWTFRIATAGTITGIGALEVGDMIVCVTNYATAYDAANWSAIQTNIDGAVTSANALTANQLVVGNGSTAVKALAAGTNGQVLKMVNNIPTWSTDNTTRAINVNGAAFLAVNTSTPVDFVAGTSITLGTDKATGKITINSNALTSANMNALSFQNNGTAVLSYNPVTAAMTVNFKTGIKASSASGVLTIEHSNSIAAKTTAALGKISYDANGHITGFEEVTSLKNPNAFTYGVGTTTDSYIGDAAKTLKFAGSGTVGVSFASGTITITGEAHHQALMRVGATNTTSNAATTNGNTYLKIIENNAVRSNLKISGSGAASVTSDASGNITITGTNTWRNVTAFKLSTASSGQVLATTVGTADLDFGDEFIWDDDASHGGRLHLGWAEVDAAGAITYAI